MSLTFWDGDTYSVEVPDPASYDLSFPTDTEPTLTQGGFFLPLTAPDDVEAVVQMSWDNLDDLDLSALRAMGAPTLLSFNDPLDLYLSGYIKALDHQTVDGRVSTRTWGPVYAAQVTFQVTHLKWPDVMGELAPGVFPPGTRYGISATGRQPAGFEGAANTVVGEEGWATVQGGDTEPWGPVVPPIRPGPWNRADRTRIAPIHGVQANFMSLDTTQLPPLRGSVFLALKPLSAP